MKLAVKFLTTEIQRFSTDYREYLRLTENISNVSGNNIASGPSPPYSILFYTITLILDLTDPRQEMTFIKIGIHERGHKQEKKIEKISLLKDA